MNTMIPGKSFDAPEQLLAARAVAQSLFEHIRTENIIRPGARESELNEAVYRLAESRFGIRKYWHKRIVRAGRNTTCAYRENPEDWTLRENEIVYFDFGPILEGMEADFARTYILGDCPAHHAMLRDLTTFWQQCREAFLNTSDITGAQLYAFLEASARKKGYELAEWHCGHLLGLFPHEERFGEEPVNYICPENETPLNHPASNGEGRFWVLEVHLVRPDREFGGFIEDLLLPEIEL